MPNIAIVGSSLYPDLHEDDRLILPKLDERGLLWSVVRWDDPGAAWAAYDAVVVREPWDYYLRPAEFRAWVDARDADRTNLWNPAEVLRWNMNKRYLQDLQAAGADVVETEWIAHGTSAALRRVLDRNGWARAVVKPGISAGAHETWEVTLEDAAGKQAQLDALLAGGDVLVQPFLEHFVDEGEWSLIFFGGEFSHAILKRPARGDFRVQERWGGTAEAAEPPAGFIPQAEKILEAVPGELLYARADGVRDGERFVLVELEVFEPMLFLAHDGAAPGRFADALLVRLRD